MPAIPAIQPFNGILAIDCCSPMRFGLQLCNVFRGIKKEKSRKGGLPGREREISQTFGWGSWPG